MKNKIFLSSMLIMSVAPAMAEPSNTGEFPTAGLMQEDYTYTNAATSTNMDGVYEGTVNAVAEYDVINYIVNAGQYLPADSETVITCPAGSYCPGISGNVNYNQNSDQGIQTCPSGYASSAAGASSDTQCYRQCNGNVTIAHATGVTGNDYYGSGTDTCAPTSCENGYHVNTPTLLTIIGATEEAYDYVATNSNGSLSGDNGGAYSGMMTPSSAGISGEADAFVVDYGGNKGVIRGHGRCSTRSATDPWDWNNNTYTLQSDGHPTSLSDSTGQYCYCRLDSYTPYDSNTAIALSGSWVFFSDMTYVEDCATDCTNYCASAFVLGHAYNLSFRAVVLGLHPYGSAMCDANTITINWLDVDEEYAGQNDENTAVYGEDIRTPVKAQTKPGQRFKGWRFSAPEQTNLPN